MIKKEVRDEKEGTFDLKVYDKNNNFFEMTVAGNHDLYWIPRDYKNNKTFIIDKSDEFTFNVFSQLFEKIKGRDNPYCPLIKDNVFSFVSEDFPEDQAHKLQIIHNKDEIVIDFIRNKNESEYSLPRRGCVICFCNSGSRVPRIEQLFMYMFTKLAYYTDELEMDM